MLLGFKVEEMHQKVRPIINCSRSVWHRGAAPALEQRGPAFRELRQRVLDAERAVLFSLEFDVGVVHPYAAVSATLVGWRDAGVFEPGWPRGSKNSAAPREVVSARALAGNLAFALVQTEACLLHSPAELAVAALAVATDIAFVDAAGGGPVRWAHVLAALQHSEPAARRAAALRERVPALLAPLVEGDSAVFAATHARAGGVAPVPATIAELPAEAHGAGAGASAAGGAGAAPPLPSPRAAADHGARAAPAPALASANDPQLDELPQLE